MKTLLTFISALILVTSIQSCGGKKEEQAKVEAPAGMITLDLSKYGKPFTIFVPDSTVGKLQITEQTWGALEIRAGKNFQISITEDPGDIELRKTDIKQFVVEEPTTIMWESEITKSEFHFYTIQKLGNATYVFEDLKNPDNEPFGQPTVQKMLDSVKALKEIKKEAA
jgi:hypothetical protein